jgi:hypothetical protein
MVMLSDDDHSIGRASAKSPDSHSGEAGQFGFMAGRISGPYLLGVGATAGFTAALAFFTCAFLVAFLVVVVAGAVVLCTFEALGAASVATADNRVMPINFFIFFSPLLWRGFCPPTTRVWLETGAKEIGPIGDSRLRKLMNGFSDYQGITPRSLRPNLDTGLRVLIPLLL